MAQYNLHLAKGLKSILWVTWHLVKWTGLEASSPPHSSSMGKASLLNSSPYLTHIGSSWSPLSMGFQFPTSPWNYSINPITPSCRNHGWPHPLDAASQGSCLSFCPLLQPLQGLSCMWSPIPLSREQMWLVNCWGSPPSSVQVSCWPITQGWEPQIHQRWTEHDYRTKQDSS
jgi:hypothetical protein